MSDQNPAGYYRDKDGNLKRDRRKRADRRGANARAGADGDRRHQPRRAVDRDFVEREHHAMIEEALAEFAEEHEAF
jgi:hypothetical protein